MTTCLWANVQLGLWAQMNNLICAKVNYVETQTVEPDHFKTVCKSLMPEKMYIEQCFVTKLNKSCQMKAA